MQMAARVGDKGRGIVPFWFWNGDMEDSQIVAQIEAMAAQGVAGFSIHPRQGLTVPYLSKEWFRKVKLAVETGRKLGLRVWFNDEYPYPSGASGGEVFLDHPEYLARELRRITLEVQGEAVVDRRLAWGRVVFAKAYPVKDGVVAWEESIDLREYIGSYQEEQIYQDTGLSQYNRSRYFTGNPVKRLVWQCPPGNWQIFIFLECIVQPFKYFGYYIDVLNPKAIEYFLTTTYQRYLDQLGLELFREIEAVFVDEISVGGALTGMGIPWSPCLPEYFEKLNGYKLVDHLPALVADVPGGAQVRYDFRKTLLSAFINSFERPVQDWCARHGIKYAGEKPILRSTQLEYMDIPGIDAGHLKVGAEVPLGSLNYRSNPKLVSSAAHFLHKPEVLCEAFHSIGWDMTIQDMKWITDWLAVQGINLIVPHGFFYTTDGLTKHDAPPSSFWQNPYWEHYDQLAQYTSHLCARLSGGYAPAKILVLDPVTSLWTRYPGDPLTEQLLEDWQYLQEKLLRHHWEFHIADPQLLTRGRLEGSRLKLGDNPFEVIILPPTTNLEERAAEVLLAAIEAGVHVVFLGTLPFEQIEPGAKGVEEIAALFEVNPCQAGQDYLAATAGGNWFHRGRTAWYATRGSLKANDGFAELERHLEEIAERWVRIVDPAQGEERREVLFLRYRKGEDEACFLVNTSGQQFTAEIQLSRPVERVSLVDLVTNKSQPLDDPSFNGSTFALDFDRYQSYFLHFKPVERQQLPTARVYRIDTEGQWSITLKAKNLCRLGHWQMQAVLDEDLRSGGPSL